uniref:Uncharacterized protein n=1 Tax=Bostrychia moritziana TaxID=103713 RepID=A0A1Z1M776_BOSMO|nr:hypothetical protein [Bostrychia moritziana]ARW61691.1 hypothetical protein [Bostrychia moritziana]
MRQLIKLSRVMSILKEFLFILYLNIINKIFSLYNEL